MEVMRNRVNDLFGGLASEMGAWPAGKRRRQQSPAEARQDAIEMLEAKREEWLSPPTPLSDAALEAAGYPARQPSWATEEDPQF